MLVDKITIKARAGKGGDGVVRWRREKSISHGGPYGGDGGRGGNVYLEAIRDVYALGMYDANREYGAQDGDPGGSRLMEGATGADYILKVPVGSIIYNHEYDSTYKIDKEGERILILRGGVGGYGNDHFKSSTNQAPYEFTKGTKGEFATLTIEVEMIADIGIIGFPNVGKSSLLNSLTRASAKTANYAFTTLEPNLGDFHGYILADIPGLIEGASDGKGLGHKFLKHIKRTNAIIHLIAATDEDFLASYKTIRAELGAYDKTLLEKKELVIISRADEASDAGELEKKAKALEKELGGKVITLSLLDDESVKAFKKDLLVLLEETRNK
jgi:GTP-binding protein